MTAAPEPGEPRLRWWEGVASPGPGGYALAVLVSLVVLGFLGAVVEGDEIVGSVLVTVFFGAVFALFLAPIGVLLVHVATVRTRAQWVHVHPLRTRAQWVHVLVTGVVGAVAGFAVVQDAVPFLLLMGASTAIGRAAVVPLVPGVRRRRRHRERRRTSLEGLAAQGVVDGYGSPHRRPGSAAAPPADFGPTAPPR